MADDPTLLDELGRYKRDAILRQMEQLAAQLADFQLKAGTWARQLEEIRRDLEGKPTTEEDTT